jgi:hypothetical protein
MPTIAVCAIFKDEAPFLAEWVAYHRLIGVDHFFLYDNGSSDDGALLLRNGRFSDCVTVVPISARPGQDLAYQHFQGHFMKSWDWAAFIDLDEFIHPLDADSVKPLLERYANFSGVLLHQLNFGADGHLRRPTGLVIDNYTHRLSTNDWVHHHVKSLVRTADFVEALSVHVFRTRGAVCNARGEETPNLPVQDNLCHDVMCLNHYYTKSFEDWTGKLAKRRADIADGSPDQRRLEWFDYYATDATVADPRITRFSARVKAMLSD